MYVSCALFIFDLFVRVVLDTDFVFLNSYVDSITIFI